ncbi:rhodanese-like domain-containing protein [Mycoplasmatota bacterium WC30]
MKKSLLLLITFFTIFLVSCSGGTGFETISAAEGKIMMDEDASIILLDVRTASEYNEEHIEGARLFPLDDIETTASKVISDKTATYIIYCRSGNRSNQASQLLVDMGYENIYDMGGIINWPYDTVG